MVTQRHLIVGWEPWSSGYGRRLTYQRSWVRIPVPYTGWTWYFFTLICCKKLYCLFEKTENKRKRGRDWPIFFNNTSLNISKRWCLRVIDYFHQPTKATFRYYFSTYTAICKSSNFTNLFTLNASLEKLGCDGDLHAVGQGEDPVKDIRVRTDD